MDSHEEELSKKISDYQQLARQNPNVDVNMLMMNALQTTADKQKNAKSHRWGYVISLSAPPFGLIFAAKYFMSDDEDDKQAAKICVLLTAVAIILLLAFGKVLFSSAGVSTQQLQQLNPKDIQQEIQ